MLLIAFEEALDRTLEGVTRLGVESVPLDGCVGRWLAGTVMAPRSMPEFEHSAMDGYALDEGLLHGDGPWTLEIHGESRAGGASPPCLAGTACRIFTGAAIPAGANAVGADLRAFFGGARFHAAVRDGTWRRAGS